MPFLDVRQSAGRLIPFPESRDLLPDAVLGDDEVRGFQAGDVISLVVRHRHVQLHHIHHDAEIRFVVLGGHPNRGPGKKTCKLAMPKK